MMLTTTQIQDGIARLAAEAAAARVDLDETPRSPFEHRAAEERARIKQARYVACWAALQKVENIDRQLADPQAFDAALNHLQPQVEAETETAIDKLERTPDEWERRKLLRQIEELEGERTIIRRGPAQVSPSFIGIPDRLVQRLTALGIAPLPGCSHIFERRGGLLTLEPLLADLRQQRAVAMAVLVRELELEPATAG